MSPSPINRQVVTLYFSCVIVHMSAWRAITSGGAGVPHRCNCLEVSCGFQMPGRINPPPAMTATRCLDPQPESCPCWLWYERAGQAEADKRQNEGKKKKWRGWLLSITKDKVQIGGACVWLTALCFWLARGEMGWDVCARVCVCVCVCIQETVPHGDSSTKHSVKRGKVSAEGSVCVYVSARACMCVHVWLCCAQVHDSDVMRLMASVWSFGPGL